MVKIFRGGYGYSSCIINDNLYNFFDQNSQSITVWRDTNFTDLGNVMRAAAGVDFNGFYCTVLQALSQDQINMATAMYYLHRIFPQANYATVSDAPTADFTAKQFQGTSYFAVKQLQNSVQPQNSSIVCWYLDSDTYSTGSRFGDNQQCSPFGYVTTQTVYQSFVVFKSDLSTFYLIRISIGYTGLHPQISTYRLSPGLSVGNVLQMTTWYNLIDLYGTDPYTPGGITDPTPPLPTGDFDGSSDPIDFPPVPAVNALNCNFITLYTPSLTQIQALATYLWGPGFNVNDLKKIVNNPMDVILGLSIVPVEVPHSDTPGEIGFGNIVSTGCYMYKATQQYVDVDCGTLNLHEFWGAYLDYEPYTKVSIYLPYIGYRPMSIDDCMNTAIHVKYRVDVLTGACIAMIKCNDHILYEHAGACSVSIPITATDWTNVINGIISSVVSTAGIIAGTVTGAAPLTAASAMAAVSSAAQNTMQMKPTVDRSGTISSSVGFLGVQKPYLILTRPRQALPAEQNTFTGYPSWITAKLGDLTGFTQVAEIHLHDIACTDAEKDMIEAALKEGVIL